MTIEEVITARRSTRRFARRPIERPQLGALLRAAAAPIPGDVFSGDLIQRFLIVNAVEGMEPGKYMGDHELIEPGDFRRFAAGLALGQPIAGQAAVNIYFMAHLDAVFERLGDRGYRVAQMAGAIAGGRVELAATAAGLGATGLTFFDDEVTEFFEPAAQGRQVMYLVSAGHPAN
jgi:nitroreductase